MAYTTSRYFAKADPNSDLAKPVYNAPTVSAAGSRSTGPAQKQDLLGTTSLDNFDKTYSSDNAPAVVSSHPDPYTTPPTALTTPIGPTPSQSPSVTVQGTNTTTNPNTNTSTGQQELSTITSNQSTINPDLSTVTSGTGTPSSLPTTTSGPEPTSPTPILSPQTIPPAPNTASSTPVHHFTGDPSSLAALTAMPTVDDYIRDYLGGQPTGRMTSDGKFNLDDVLRSRPDVYNGFFTAFNGPNNDKNSTAWMNRVGGFTPEDYANYWYNTYALNSDPVTQGLIKPVTTPPPTTTTSPPTGGGPVVTNPGGDPITLPPGTNTNPDPGTGLGDGGTTGATDADKLAALNQAIARAKLAVMGRGLNWDNYSHLFLPFYNDIYNTIPATDTNPNAFFDPNAANTILSGEESRQRAGFRQQALGLQQHVDPHMLDDTIASILGDSSNQGMQMLENGLKRGQFNDQGYQGGMSALSKAQEAAKAKLLGFASDYYKTYDQQLGDVENQALSAASGYQLGDTFDLSPYVNQDQQILDMAKASGAGQLYQLIGDQPLINLADMRMAAGTAQGAVNLNDLDVLAALAKRKQANAVGNGIGSEGSF